MIKIFAYEVRPDEMPTFERMGRELPVEVTCCPDSLAAATLPLCAGCQGITTLGHSTLDREMLGKLRAMGITALSTRTVGTNHIDLAAAKELGIQVCNTGYGPECVAEHALMLLLVCLRNYKPALWRMQVNDYSLAGLQGRQIGSLTIGIIGTGRIGARLMQDLSGFGCKMLCYDPYPNEHAAKLGTYVSLDEIWANCDVISFHTPLTAENFHMVNRESLKKMKKGVILINTARGGLMDVEALIEGIESQQIGRLAMDVFDEEDGIYHENRRDDILKNRSMAYLRQFPNVVLTPHMAFYTAEAVERMVEGGVGGVYEMLTTGTTGMKLV